MAETTAKMVMDWYSDASKALADMQSIIGKQDQMIKGLKESSRASKESAKAMREIKDGASEALGLLGIGGGIAGGVAFISQQTQRWLAFSRDVYQTYLNVNKELIKSIGLSGDMMRLTEVKSKLEKMNLPESGMAERGQAYLAVKESMPGTPVDQAVQLAYQGLRGAKLYGDGVKFSGLVADVADAYGGKLTPEDAADTAAAAIAGFGGQIDKFGTIGAKSMAKLTKGGMEPNSAMTLLIAAARSEQLKEIGGLTDLFTGSKNFAELQDPVTGKNRTVSSKEKTEMDFYKLNAEQRLSWLKKNRGTKEAADIFSDTGALNAIFSEDFGGIEAGIKSAQKDNLFNNMLTVIEKDPSAEDISAEKKLNVSNELAKTNAAAGFKKTELARKIFDNAQTRYLASGGLPLFSTLNSAAFETSLFFGTSAENALHLERADEMKDPIQARITKEDLAPLLKENNRLLEEQNKILRDNKLKTGGGVSVLE